MKDSKADSGRYRQYRRDVLAGVATGAAGLAVSGVGSAASRTKNGRSAQKKGTGDTTSKHVEALDRGLVAIPTDNGVLVRWRLLGTESMDLGFDVYRDGTRVTNKPITGSTNYLDPEGTTESTYAVRALVDGRSGGKQASEKASGMSESVAVWDNQYKDIPLNKPDAAPEELGQYHANDASVGDLTGDGTLDIVLKWSPENAKDNSQEGVTSNVLIDAYSMDGEHLWRVDLGRNVRAGAHYTPFVVYDFDGDGKAELAVRTSDGSVDGTGAVIGDADANYVNDAGRILTGPEYLTIFDGETGEELATTDFEPARGDPCDWGDCYGNRVDRFLAGAAYLDGERPSIVMTRGYYEKTMLAAWDFQDGELSLRWLFDSEHGYPEYEGKGAHTLATADADGDGKDEVIFGGMVIDHDGSPLHTSTMANPDALHCGDFAPNRDGLEILVPAENPGTGEPSLSMRDAETGEYIWTVRNGADVGRALVADVDPNYIGAEGWGGTPLSSDGGTGTYSASGEKIREDSINSFNSAIWWTGDLHRELLDHDFLGWDEGYGVGWIKKWDWEAETLDSVVSFEGTRSNNSSKGNPCLSGDILGDWREEVIWRTDDSEALRLYATPYETDHRLHTLLHNPQYRTAIARQNVGYNQPPWPNYFLGHGMDMPPAPNIEPIPAAASSAAVNGPTEVTVGERVEFQVEDTTGNDRWIKSLEWQFDDGETASGWYSAHRFNEPGVYRVVLIATDNTGASTTETHKITVSGLSGKLAEIRPSMTEATVDERVQFRVNDTSDNNRWIQSLEWTFGDGEDDSGWYSTYQYDSTGSYTVELTAIDNTGVSTTDEVTIDIS